jgi:polyketide synthase 12
LSTETALRLLDAALESGVPIVAAGLDSHAVREAGRGRRRAAAAANGSGSLARRLASVPPGERTRVVLDVVRENAAVVLGHGDASEIAASLPFRDLGFDSLTAVELRNRLSAVTELALPATMAFDYPTPGTLSEHLLRQMMGAPEDPEDARLRDVIRAIPMSRLRDAGLLDVLLKLAGTPADGNGNGNGDTTPGADIDELSSDDLIRMALEENDD